jgi:hypothetical protein
MTGLALIPDWRAQQGMRELAGADGQFQTCVIAMTIQAALLGQFLMEGGLEGSLGERDTLSCLQPDICNGMTLHTALRVYSTPWRVAGEAIFVELMVSDDQRARAQNEERSRNAEVAADPHDMQDVQHRIYQQ